MKSPPRLASNFSHLREHDEQLLRLGILAERYFADDPNTCLLKLRQLAELLAQMAASGVGIFDRPDEGQYELPDPQAARRLNCWNFLPVPSPACS